MREKNNYSRKTALVMEGGAMRGMFTCGVIDMLPRHDIRFDGAAAYSDEARVDFETVRGQGHAMAGRTGSSTDNFLAWVHECMQ